MKLRVQDISRRYKVSRQTIYNWINKKGLKKQYVYHGLKRVVVIDEDDLKQFLPAMREEEQEWQDLRRKQ